MEKLRNNGVENNGGHTHIAEVGVLAGWLARCGTAESLYAGALKQYVQAGEHKNTVLLWQGRSVAAGGPTGRE